MSLSTVFSLLTSSSQNITDKTTEEEEDDTTNSNTDSPTTATTIGSSSPATTVNINSTSETTDANFFSSVSSGSISGGSENQTAYHFINSTLTSTSTETSYLDEDFSNGTIDISNNSEFSNDSSINWSHNGNANTNISSNFTNELEFQSQEYDANNNSMYNSTDFSIDNLGETINEPTTYVPLFYFLLTVVLGIYVYLYFLQRHLKSKAARDVEDEQKKKVEERIKRGGCRYDYEDEDESDYGPPEQNLSVSALRFYGGGSRT